jgi:hypothetical protein
MLLMRADRIRRVESRAPSQKYRIGTIDTVIPPSTGRNLIIPFLGVRYVQFKHLPSSVYSHNARPDKWRPWLAVLRPACQHTLRDKATRTSLCAVHKEV